MKNPSPKSPYSQMYQKVEEVYPELRKLDDQLSDSCCGLFSCSDTNKKMQNIVTEIFEVLDELDQRLSKVPGRRLGWEIVSISLSKLRHSAEELQTEADTNEEVRDIGFTIYRKLDDLSLRLNEIYLKNNPKPPTSLFRTSRQRNSIAAETIEL